jgi:hypothetical protein
LKTVAKELAKCKLDLIGVQEVRWEKGGTEPAGNYKFSVGMRIMNERWDFLYMTWNHISS